MNLNEKDLTAIDNIVKIIKRGVFELKGEEILIFSDAFHWLASLAVKIREEKTPRIVESPIKEETTKKKKEK